MGALSGIQKGWKVSIGVSGGLPEWLRGLQGFQRAFQRGYQSPEPPCGGWRVGDVMLSGSS